MKILVTGSSGFVGSRLAPRLLRDGHQVVGLSRQADGSRHPDGYEVRRGDATTGSGLVAAMTDVSVAYYLIHSMEPADGDSFSDRERRGAENFARAAAEAGVERIVYLGGLLPAEKSPSPHLSSRLAVEEILLGALPNSVAFRASIVIGAASRSFRFLVHLVERLPVLAVPSWHARVTRPIDERDVIELLSRAATDASVAGQSLDIAGPDTVSYGGLIERIRDHMLVGRPTVRLSRISLTPIASRIAALIGGEEHALIGPLMGSLEDDLLPRDERAAELLGLRLHGLDAAIERALREWEEREPLAAR